MIIGNNDPKLLDFFSYMAKNDKSRSSDPYWYTMPQDEKYLAWFAIEKDSKIIACSAVQKFQNCGRILTRFCIDPLHRTKNMQQNKHSGSTYAFQIVEEQLMFCKLVELDHAFFSTENSRIGVIKRHVKIAKNLGYNCKLLEDRYNTCSVVNEDINESSKCWQNICLYPLSNKIFSLPKEQLKDIECKF